MWVHDAFVAADTDGDDFLSETELGLTSIYIYIHIYVCIRIYLGLAR